MQDIYYQSEFAPVPEESIVELPPMVPFHKQIPAFLSLPLELRLQIYDLCFFQDIQKYSTRTRKFLSEGDYPVKCHDFALLLVNHQIHDETAALAYAAQRRQLVQSHQTYYLSPTRLNPKSSKNWKWDLEGKWVWQPSCRSAKALAALRLPKLGLAFRCPYRAGVYSMSYPNKNLEDQIDALGAFFRSLVYHLRQKNATESIDIYLEGHNSEFLRCIFGASEELFVSRCFTRSRETQYEVTYISDDPQFVAYGEYIARNLGGKARIKAPEEVGRRFPADLSSRLHWWECEGFEE